MYQVADTLKSPYHASLERLESRKFIERDNLNDVRVFKSSIRYFSDIVLFWFVLDDFLTHSSRY